MRPAVLLSFLGLSLSAQAADPNQVTMDLDQFIRLYESTKDRPKDPEKAPWEVAVSSARYSGEVVMEDGEPSAAVFKARVRVSVLKSDGWVRVPLLHGSTALKSARIGGQEAAVSHDGGWYALVTDRKGAFDVDLEFAVAINQSSGQSQFSFPMVRAGGNEMTLEVPDGDAMDFVVDNARLQQDATRNGRRSVTAVLPSNGNLSVHWQRSVQPDPEAGEEGPDARVYAEVHTLATLGDGALRARTVVNETILFAGIQEVQLDVPADMTVLDVQGKGLRDWTRSDDGRLTALLNFEAEGNYTLTLELEKVLESGDGTEVPLVQVVGAERSKGWVGVQALGNLEVLAGQTEGVANVDVRTLPANIIGVTGQPVLLGFKYLGDGVKIPIDVLEHEEVDVLMTLLEQAVATTMFTADGRRLTRVSYRVNNNRRQFLRLALPDGAELWSASVAGKPVQPAAGSDGRLMLPLVRSQASGGGLASFAVDVVYVESGEGPDGSGRGSFEAVLPTADVPTKWVGWSVYAPWEAKVKANSLDGSLKPVDWLSHPATADQAFEVQAEAQAYANVAADQARTGGLGRGVEPVQVSLPLDGEPYHFEKLLALDEALWVRFDYKGLK